MKPTVQIALLTRVLRSCEEHGLVTGAMETSLDANRYYAAERYEKERRLLLRTPLIVGRATELPEPGSFFTLDFAEVPLLIVRDAEGQVRAFLNVCRHRGSVLCSEPCGQRKAFVCRYHGWAYKLSGHLLNVPMREAFPTLRDEENGLIELPLISRHGFLLVTPTPSAALPAPSPVFDLQEFDEDLDSFGLKDHVVHKRNAVDRACNWKLVIDAFLEGYHVKSLHRESLARFFEDTVVFDFAGPNVRSMGARRGLVDTLRRTPQERWDARQVATLFYLLFPNSILVFHPDWVSHITVHPLGPDRCRCVHTMLVPRAPSSDAERDHLNRSFALIHDQVFEREDLAIAESVHRGLRALPEQRYHLGTIEYPIWHFHRSLDQHLDGA